MQPSDGSVPHLCEIGAKLKAKGVSLKVLDQAIDTSTPTGRLMFNLLGSIAQFERELTRERMLVGIAKAKAEGTARAKVDKVRELREAGVRPAEIARQAGISRTSVYGRSTAELEMPEAGMALPRGSTHGFERCYLLPMT
jgi:DNA invertase Pin-like site-specific DNA recombinase